MITDSDRKCMLYQYSYFLRCCLDELLKCGRRKEKTEMMEKIWLAC